MKHAEQVFRLVGRGFIFATILAAPWCLGGVYVSTQYWLGVGIVASLISALIAEILGAGCQWKVPLVVWPILIGLLIGVAQLIPLDKSTLASISPWTSEWNEKLLAEGPGDDTQVADSLSLPTLDEKRPIAIYPTETRYGLAYFSLAAGAVIAGISLFRTRQSLLVMLAALGTNSFAISLFAIVQKLTWNGAIYWSIPLSRSDEVSSLGPFVNRNNGAGYLLIGLGCMTGWLLYSLEKSEVIQLRSGNAPVGGYRIGLIDRINLLHAGHLTLFSMTGCIMGGILCSVSRGGILSMCCAVIAVSTAMALLSRKIVLAAIMPAIFSIGVFLLFWVGWNVPLEERIDLMLEKDMMSEQDNFRLMNWSDALQVVPESPWLGSGLFTYRYAYRPYQEGYTSCEFYHAENFYVQTLVETGISGIILLFTAITLTAFSLYRLLRSKDRILNIVGLAGLFVLTSQIVSSCFDFGLHIPSNILTLSLLFGGLSALCVNRSVKSNCDKAPRWRSGCRIAYRLTFPLLGCLIALSAVLELHVAAVAEKTQAEVRPLIDAINSLISGVDVQREDITDQEIQLGLESLNNALRLRPDDAVLHEQSAVLLLEQYSRNVKGEPSTAIAIFVCTQMYLPDQLAALRRDEEVRNYIHPAMRHAVLARRASPMLQNPHLLLAQLSGLTGPVDG
jgi:hypothetical protein